MFYYRETSRESEPRIPFEEKILHIDEHLIVVDKPPFSARHPQRQVFAGNLAHAPAFAAGIAVFEC